MTAYKLLRSHRYAEAIQAAQNQLAINNDDWSAVGVLASTHQALREYEAALPYLQRLDAEARNDIVPGRPGERQKISCIYWFLGDKPRAISLMRELVQGILDHSITYGDLAGGVKQGLLLFYMAITLRDSANISFSLKYLRNRSKRRAIQNFPGHIARYYLDEIEFPEVLAAATEGRARDVPAAIKVAGADLLSRRFLCNALFHDGVKARSRDDEPTCQNRMRECFQLEDPLIESEWYLARHEIEHAFHLVPPA